MSLVQLALFFSSLAALESRRAPITTDNSSLHHREKRSPPQFNGNCPRITLLSQNEVRTLPGIAVDSQLVTYDDTLAFNVLRCSEDTVFAFKPNGTHLTAQPTWWLACGPRLSNGWRVRKDESTKSSAFANVKVGCVRPTCNGAQLFMDNDEILDNYPMHKLVPNRPTLTGTNQKFQFTCPVGSTLGYADSALTVDASAKIVCDVNGWWVVNTKSNTNVKLLSPTEKFGCFRNQPTSSKCAPLAAPSSVTTTIPFQQHSFEKRILFECQSTSYAISHLPYGNFGAGGPLVMENTNGYKCDPAVGKLLSMESSNETMLTTATCREAPVDKYCMFKLNDFDVILEHDQPSAKCAEGFIFQLPDGGKFPLLRCSNGELFASNNPKDGGRIIRNDNTPTIITYLKIN